MRDSDCIHFLQWALPRLRKRWPGFRKVRRQVCRRVAQRLRELGLPDTEAYRRFLEAHDQEWDILDGLCRITISRFYRDRGVFGRLAGEVLPALAREAAIQGCPAVRCWSAGCASGEEAYTLALLWHCVVYYAFPRLGMEITASDIDDRLLARARRACYPVSSLKDLPAAWRRQAFRELDGEFCLLEKFRGIVRFERQDIRAAQPPAGRYHMILCRNLVFTYFDAGLQEAVLQRFSDGLVPGGVLVIGIHEKLPAGSAALSVWPPECGIYRKILEGQGQADGKAISL